jgi:hypothetical protein
MFVPWTKENVIAKTSHILESNVMLTWVGYIEHKELKCHKKIAACLQARPWVYARTYVRRLRLEIHLNHMKTEGSLLGFSIVQCSFVCFDVSKESISPVKLIHPEDGCGMLLWNIENNATRCKHPKHDYHLNNIHPGNLVLMCISSSCLKGNILSLHYEEQPVRAHRNTQTHFVAKIHNL